MNNDLEALQLGLAEPVTVPPVEEVLAAYGSQVRKGGKPKKVSSLLITTHMQLWMVRLLDGTLNTLSELRDFEVWFDKLREGLPPVARGNAGTFVEAMERHLGGLPLPNHLKTAWSAFKREKGKAS